MGHSTLFVKEKITDLTKSEKKCLKTINICTTGNSCFIHFEQYFLALLYTIVYWSMHTSLKLCKKANYLTGTQG